MGNETDKIEFMDEEALNKCRNPQKLLDQVTYLREYIMALRDKNTIKKHKVTLELAKSQLEILNWDDLRGFHWRIVWRVLRFTLQRLKIEDKDGENARFMLNSSQLRLLQIYAKCISQGIAPFIMILKARQIGFSTLIEAIFYLYFSRNREGMNVMVLAHKAQSTDVLFRMFRHYHREDEIAFPLERSNARIISYKDRRGAVEVTTGKTSDSGRSMRLNGIHFSEAAHYQDPDALIPGMLPSVPKNRPYAHVAVETTANGAGGWFYEAWSLDQPGWIKFFVAWFEHEEYEKKFTSNAERADFEAKLKPADEAMMGAYPKITWEKLHWYVSVRETEHATDPDIMKQEYPCSEEEAFLYAGRPVFQPEDIMRHEKNIALKFGDREPPTYEILLPDKFSELPGDNLIEKIAEGMKRPYLCPKNDQGRFTIFERPRENRFYAIGMDVAEGIELGTVKESHKAKHGRSKTDDTVIKVLCYAHKINDKGDEGKPRFRRCKEVAVWQGKIQPYHAAKLLYIIAVYYNWAYVGVEANRNGMDVIAQLHRTWKYPKNYFLKYTRKINDGKNKIIEQEELGWLTSPTSRPTLINDLIEDVIEDNFRIFDKGLISEMKTFIYDKNGKAIHQYGRHDDNIFAAAIARQVIKIKYERSVEEEEHKDEMEVFEEQLQDWETLEPGKSAHGMTVT